MPSLKDLENLIPIATPVVQGIVNGNASGNAINNVTQGNQQAQNTITTGAQKAQETLNTTNQQNQSLLAPYQKAGTDSLTTLQNGLQPGGGMADPFKYLPPDLANDPIFQRRLKQGMDAITAKGNAGGNRFSKATMADYADYATGSANDFLASDYARQEGTFRANQKDAFDRNLSVEQLGQNAANKGVDANTNFGTQTVGLTTGTSKSIADLQQEKAQALGAGDILKANAIDGMLAQLSEVVQHKGDMSTLQQFLNPNGTTAPASSFPWQGPTQTPPVSLASGAAPALGSAGLPAGLDIGGGIGAAAGPAIAAPSLAGGVAATVLPATSLASVGAAGGGVLAGTGALATPEIAAPALASGAGAGGMGAAITGFLTNPITIGIGAALAGALIWKNSQVHPTADTFVNSFQNPFGQHLGAVVDAFDHSLASGQLSKQDAQKAFDQTKALIDGFEQDRQAFAAKGGKEKTVASQAEQTMIQNFGPNYEKILGKMQQEIAALPEAA